MSEQFAKKVINLHYVKCTYSSLVGEGEEIQKRNRKYVCQQQSHHAGEGWKLILHYQWHVTEKKTDQEQICSQFCWIFIGCVLYYFDGNDEAKSRSTANKNTSRILWVDFKSIQTTSEKKSIKRTIKHISIRYKFWNTIQM